MGRSGASWRQAVSKVDTRERDAWAAVVAAKGGARSVAKSAGCAARFVIERSSREPAMPFLPSPARRLRAPAELPA